MKINPKAIVLCSTERSVIIAALRLYEREMRSQLKRDKADRAAEIEDAIFSLDLMPEARS